MAEPFLSDLALMVNEWSESEDTIGPFECRHFFSGAAAYRNGAIVATLTPVGLAFKVSSEVHDALIADGSAQPLQYFSKSPVKRDYVLFPEGVVSASQAIMLLLSVGSAT